MTLRYNLVYLIFALTLTWIITTGNSTGAMQEQGIDRTGSPFSPATCQECHSANAFSPSVDIAVLEDGQPINAYIPGESYTLRVVVNAAPQAARFGFQALAISGPSNQQAGIFQNAPFGIAIRNKDGRQYPEQSFKSLSKTFELTWVAPEIHTGSVRLYAAGVAANNNSSSSGDGAAHAVLEIQESGMSSLMPTAMPVSLDVRVAGGGIIIDTPTRPGQVRIFDLTGRTVAETYVSGGEYFLPLPALLPAVYILQWTDGAELVSTKFFYVGQ